ncbi:hypothetical protein H696_02261 [Fonticula alba]|uniref:riboflavin kinase n=1 Tax=Fonticula alba TaxID=691883 RepID=A0A058ZAG0_FONAL|nr:hypothetical protein H696_02261 [Fonticula alba]KCV71315.1 hypothetical protein H696_02261 [Fonticula alba]|eukprot:XP_009494438.1 hypothetical protein H696_02261 [Fonticula alba]
MGSSKIHDNHIPALRSAGAEADTVIEPAQDTSVCAPSGICLLEDPVKGYVPLPGGPVFAQGRIVHGFGRGSSQLGIPTANLPENISNAAAHHLPTGVYFGYALVSRPDSPVEQDSSIPPPPSPSIDDILPKHALPMVMSLGWNPHFADEKKSMEVHILWNFSRTFYGAHLRVAVLGYIRPERKFPSLRALVKSIRRDIEVARRILDPEGITLQKPFPPCKFESADACQDEASDEEPCTDLPVDQLAIDEADRRAFRAVLDDEFFACA